MLINAGLSKYMDGEYFEQFIGELYSFLGYKVSTTSTTGDQGLDLIVSKEDINRNKVTIGIQCKRYKGNVGNSAVQEVFAGKHYYSCDKAVVITPSRFTASARELAKVLKVDLIGTKELNNLLSDMQEFLIKNFYISYKLSEILINSTSELIGEDNYGQDTISAVQLLEHMFKYKDKINPSLVGLLVNNLCIGLKRLGRLSEAILYYEESLIYISFTDEERRYVIVGNLLVAYLDNHDFKKAKEISNTVKESELKGLSPLHFKNIKIEIEKGLNGDHSRDSMPKSFVQTNKK